MKIFYLQLVISITNKWCKTSDETVGSRNDEFAYERSEVAYVVEGFIYFAENVENAYRKAISHLEGSSDVNHDGPGDITFHKGEGIHQLTEYDLTYDEFISKMGTDEGMGLSEFIFDSIDNETAKPLIRMKSELKAFL